MTLIKKEDLGLEQLKEEIDIISSFLNLYLRTSDKSNLNEVINTIHSTIG